MAESVDHSHETSYCKRNCICGYHRHVERQTRQRDAVLTALSDSGRSLTPQEICELAQRSVPSLNISTVYRQLKGLLEHGEILSVDLPGQPPRYEAPCKSDHAQPDHHHHHFHCDDCGRVFPIHGCPGSMEDLAPDGFLVRRHDVTLHGRCADCSGGPPTSRAGRPRNQRARPIRKTSSGSL
ncbi:transcriptional repressor [Variovorax sp. WDL1]|uniref:Fur family transcriptional regulator n=1 Tax=unclassified Variovorax TaxID=663243 RepID=UPI002F9663EF